MLSMLTISSLRVKGLPLAFIYNQRAPAVRPKCPPPSNDVRIALQRTEERPRMQRPTMAMLILIGALSLVACGGAEKEQPAKPTSVVAGDLDKDGNFWLTLTPDLKDELVELGKSRLGEQRPDGATGIRAMSADKLVVEVEKEYANASKRSSTIFSTYTGANDKLAAANFDDAINQLDQLCNSEPRPPECDE